VLRDENATVLLFRDAAMRRPIDVVAWMNARAPFANGSTEPLSNVVPLARFARASRGGVRRTWFAGPPEGEAA
jgi:hypothetical protein